MNDMSQALRNAGYSSSFERLINIAQDAWSRSPGGKDFAMARYRYVQDRLSGDLTYEMIQKWKPDALRESINYLLASTKPKANSSVVGFLSTDGGQPRHDTQANTAPVTSSPDPAQAGGGGQYRVDTHALFAPANNDASPLAHRSEPATQPSTPKKGLPAAPSISILADRQQAAAQARLGTMQRLSKLDEVCVEWPGFISKPIGDCTVAEVKRWIEIRQSDARRAGRDVRFASVLVANLTSNLVLRDYWLNPAEVEKIYAKAEAENNAA